jgi:O-acetylhomoserine/O-acetylserine sulfhydrylase-like pyridoxal-dependent enzyme
MTEPSPGYHGIRFYEQFGAFGYLMKCRPRPCATSARPSPR